MVILQEKLEEKEDEIRRLKLQLQDNGKDNGDGDGDGNGNVEEQTGLAVDDNANDEGASPAEVQTEN